MAVGLRSQQAGRVYHGEAEGGKARLPPHWPRWELFRHRNNPDKSTANAVISGPLQKCIGIMTD